MANTVDTDAAVNRLRGLLRTWDDRLRGEDVHAIAKQVKQVLWWSAFYRSINESRRFIPQTNDGRTLANGSLHELLHVGYLTIHLVFVRRLLDDNTRVNSLVNLIKEIKRECALLTRANMLAARGLEYDYAPIKAQAAENAFDEADGRARHIPGVGWSQAELWHLLVDDLCGTSENNRTPQDTPTTSQFQGMLDGLKNEGKALIAYVNKYIAHAAVEEEREKMPSEYHKLALAKLWRAECAIARVVNFVSRCVVSGTHCASVAIPAFEQFQYLDQPFVSGSALKAMETAWDEHKRELDACRDWSWSEPLTTDADTRQ